MPTRSPPFTSARRARHIPLSRRLIRSRGEYVARLPHTWRYPEVRAIFGEPRRMIALGSHPLKRGQEAALTMTIVYGAINVGRPCRSNDKILSKAISDRTERFIRQQSCPIRF